MRFNTLSLLSTLLIFAVASAQKQEIKSAFKKLREGYPQGALTAISDLDYKILNATDEEKSDYFYIKGTSFRMLAESNKADKLSLGLSVQAFKELLITENATQLFKYSEAAKSALYDIKRKLVKEAILCSNEKKFIESADKFYQAYQFDPNEISNLYFAACAYMSGKNNTTALKIFTELKKQNYSGKVLSYYAVNNITGNDDEFFSKSDRNAALKAGTHSKISLEMDEPNKDSILKNIIILNFLLNNTENAKKAILEFKVRSPLDGVFNLAELKLYIETKDYLTFEKILLERIDRNPNDADLYFYLGVINEKLGRKKEAKKYFTQTLNLNPLYQFENDARLTSYMEAEKLFDSWNKNT